MSRNLSPKRAATGPIKRLQMGVQRLIHTRLWGMDIDPTAYIEPTALIDRTFPRGVHIGPDCYVGEHAVVLTHDFTRGLYLTTSIGARTHLGARSIVLPGITVGEDCIVEPGALVNRDMPAASTAQGNPATISPRTDAGRQV
jgi:acetyltransferase-like isoleucine patch superfamily enzyme